MNKSKLMILGINLLTMSCTTLSCSKDTTTPAVSIVAVDKAKFLSGGLAEPITIVSRTLSDGTTADCYKIVVKSIPTDHAMGPWCPTNIADDASKGGIWLEGGKVYDVDGAFIKNMATFYKDATWQMYNTTTGAITKTLTQADCEAAANPNVGVAYKNYCVECLPSYVASLTHTYYIPVTPKVATTDYVFTSAGGVPPVGSGVPPAGGGGPPAGSTLPSIRGLAFNGVVFDAPAPTDRILGAYTLAPFDDAGGHINLAAGYHYHAATGVSTKITQTDGHAAMIGYAMDGFGIFGNLDAAGKEYTDLDASRGHTDATRGYHYHVDNAEKNNFINGLHGEYAN